MSYVFGKRPNVAQTVMCVCVYVRARTGNMALYARNLFRTVVDLHPGGAVTLLFFVDFLTKTRRFPRSSINLGFPPR